MMCYTQQIHTAHHASLLVFDAAAQQAHVCHLSYPATTDGNGGLKCPLHSCCRVTSELVFQCVAVKNGTGTCTTSVNDANGEDGVNGAYEEVVYVPFERGEEPVWEAAGASSTASSSPSPAPGGKGEGKDEGADTKTNTKKKWSWGRDKNCEAWEVLWDAVAEGGDGLFQDEADDADDTANDDSDGSSNGSDAESSRRSSARISQYYPGLSPAAAAAVSTVGTGSEPGSAREETFSVGGDWDDEHSEEGEIPHMEFWSFNTPLPTPSPTSSSFPSSPDCESNCGARASSGSGSPAVPSFGEGARVGEFLRPLPTGKTVIYLEDPADVLDMMISELQLVGRLDPDADADVHSDCGCRSDTDTDADSVRGVDADPTPKGDIRSQGQDGGKEGWWPCRWWRRNRGEKGMRE